MKNPYPLARPIMATVLGIALIISGCSAQQWVDLAIKDAPVILQIVLSILSIADVAAVPQAQSAGAEAQKDLALVSKLLGDIKADIDPAAKSKALADLQAALQASNSDISAILAAVHVSNPAKQASIAAGIGVALSTLLAIESLIPVASGAKSASSAVAPPSAKSVKSAYNTVIRGAYPSAVLK